MKESTLSVVKYVETHRSSNDLFLKIKK